VLEAPAAVAAAIDGRAGGPPAHTANLRDDH